MAAARLTPRLVAVMAVATGVTVANNYYAQPLLPLIRTDEHLSAAAAGLIVTIAQVGYAVGLVLLLPLGDLGEPRRIIATLSALLAAGLLAMGTAPAAGVLLAAAFAVGCATVLAQILVPFAAGLATEEERGRVVGTVMSGLLLGILLARTVAGALALTGTWRAVYYVGAAIALAQAAVLWRVLPPVRGSAELSYPALLRSVAALFRAEPALRLRSAYGALSFGAFSVLWTSLAFLLAGPPYRYGPGIIGLFGLVGAAGALAASGAGRMADRGHTGAVTAATAVLLAACWAAIWVGRSSLAALIVGIVALDLGTQGMHITNQSVIYRLPGSARSRINSAYMTCYFLGGAMGSAVAGTVYAEAGWSGVCLAGAAFSAGTVALLAVAR